MRMDPLPPIRYRTYIAAPIEVVYEAVASGDGWASWFADEAAIDPRPGGRYDFRWHAFGADRTQLHLTGPVLAATPPAEFTFRWGDEGTAEEDMTTVEFSLEERPPGTIVRVVESGYTHDHDSVRFALDCASGWGEALTLLKFWLEHGLTYGTVPEES